VDVDVRIVSQIKGGLFAFAVRSRSKEEPPHGLYVELLTI
jgi:hypothetical protein